MRSDPWSGAVNHHSWWFVAGVTTASLALLGAGVTLVWDVTIADRIAITKCVVYGTVADLEQDVDGQVMETSGDSSGVRCPAACSAERRAFRRILLPDRIVRTVNPTGCEP